MTLGEGKRRVLMLLNEYSGGDKITMNDDLSVRMNEFFDIAQKDVAAWQPIVRCGEIVQPASITAGTPDDYQFEVSEDAVNCLPLFVAAQLIGTTEHQSALYNLYLQMRGMLPRAADSRYYVRCVRGGETDGREFLPENDTHGVGRRGAVVAWSDSARQRGRGRQEPSGA